LEVYGPHTAGQTLVCHHAGLDGISVLLHVQEGAGDLVLHLKESADSPADVASVTLSPLPSTGPSFHHFAIPLQDDVNGKSFYLLVESPDTSADRAVIVPYSPAESSEYTLTFDGVPTPGHLSFKLHYNNLYIVKDLLRQVLSYGARSLWLLLLSALLYLLPGGAIVAWLLPKGDWVERSILATGLSVAVNALLLYATMAGLRLNSAIVIGYLALCALLIAARWVPGWRRGGLRIGHAWAHLRRDPSPLALLAILAMSLGVRIFVVRDLVAPMWGDSYQHTMIAQLMVDHGGLFDSWEPYAPLKTFTYHFGFHANVALFHWLSGDSVIHSVIWVGQMLNALAALALYPLALKVSGGNRWAGVGAVLVAGLLSPMPMYYVNWGRYTQLAGQVILPVAMWLTWQLEEKPGRDGRLVTLAAIAIAGLGVTHYRVVLLYGVFVVAWGAILVVRKWGQWLQIARVALSLALIGGLALLLFVPWGLHTFRARIPQIGQYLIREGSQSQFQRQGYSAIGDVSFYVPWGLLALSVGALLWRAFKRQFAGWGMALWGAGLLILANPHLFALPGTGIVNNFAVFIMFYVPVGVLGGTIVGQVVAQAWRWRRRSVHVLVAALLAVSAGWGAIGRIKNVDPGHALVTQADMEAMAWIRAHTPPNARFLVNGFVAYGGASVVGADAGWWIPLLTGRENTIPPLTYASEIGVAADYQEAVRDDFAQIQQRSPVSAEGVRFLQDRGITHVYVGQGNGMVGNPGAPLLDVDALLASPAFRLVYHQDQVWIFELARREG